MNIEDYDSAVAIVGMSGRFPGATGVDELWERCAAGEPGLRSTTGGGADPDWVPVSAALDDVESFDAAAFGLSPHEADLMEPQHRLVLECCWEALERAGYSPLEPPGAVGVFAGSGFPDYMMKNVIAYASRPEEVAAFAAGNERDSLTSLVSYTLGLRGPAVSVQTFCSTSLVAVHMACQSLLTYESDLALAGGVHVPLPQTGGYRYDQYGILSPTGRAASLDAGADGTVMGSGVGIVALRRMSDAVADGDVIHAVILGSAINNDGRARAGYAAPGVDGQTAVISSALAVAGVDPGSVGYVECHAVGTPMGDSIELAALARVFGPDRDRPCVLGSVKPDIGHLDRAAGVTGLIRAALGLRHRVLPGTAGYTTANPALAADRFAVQSANQPWPGGSEPRRAGVSSFGVGGTNAHAILEEAPEREPRSVPEGPHLLAFSAGGPEALDALTDRLRRHLAAHPDVELADVAYTLGISRGRFARRRAVVARDAADAVAALGDSSRWIDGETTRRDPAVRLTGADGAWLTTSAIAAVLPVEASGDAPTVLADGLTRIGARLSDADTASPVAVEPGSGLPEEAVLALVARLWLAGVTVDWPALHRDAGHRVELPTYPFQRSRHWIEPAPVETVTAPVDGPLPTYRAVWQEEPSPPIDLDARLRAVGPWLVVGDSPDLRDRLLAAGAEVVTAAPGESFQSDEIGDVTLRVDDPDDLAKLWTSLVAYPHTILHTAAVGHDALARSVPAGLGIGLVFVTPDATAVPPEAGARVVTADHDSDPALVLAAAVDAESEASAVRGGTSWRVRLVPYPLPAAGPDAPAVRAYDTVFIAGAAGDRLTERLLADYDCTVVRTSTESTVDAVVAFVDDADELRTVRDEVGGQAAGRRVVIGPPAALTDADGWLAVGLPSEAGAAPDDLADLAERALAAAGIVDQLLVVTPNAVPEPKPAGTPTERRDRPDIATPYVEPADGPEQTVAELFATELGLDRVGADDSFFDLGGRSREAVHLAFAIAGATGLPAEPTTVVMYPTPRLLTAGLLTGSAGPISQDHR